MIATHYLRCDECGVDAGKACRDDDDREAIEVCDGRVLRVNDSASRTKTSNHHGVAKSKAQLNRHKKGLELPVHVPCSWCGTSTKLLGGAVKTGSTYCPGDACQRAKVRVKSKARRGRERARAVALANPKIDRQCGHCGAGFVAATPTQICCSRLCSSRANHARERSKAVSQPQHMDA